MTAVYPANTQTFVARTDNVDTVQAVDVNLLYDEVTAIEVTVGTSPQVSAGWSGSFDNTTTDFVTVKARLQNLEYGTNAAFTNRVNVAGGSQILPANTSTVGLSLKAAGTSGSNLLEIKNSSNTVVTAVGPDGWIVTIDGGTA
jgi:hypothetical protein